MQENNLNKNSDNKQIQKSRSRKIVSKILSFFAGTILTLALLCFCIASSTTFRQFVIGKVLTLANNFLVADIQIKDIRFNRIYGIAIDDLKIITANDTLANVEKTIIDFSFEKFIFENKIVVNAVELHNPKIKLLRSTADSVWNFAKIVKPPETPSPPKTTPNTTIINVNSLKIKNGEWMYWDSIASWKPASKIHFLQMKWDEMELDLRNTIVDIGNSSYSTTIAFLATKEIRSGMKIDKLTTNAKISKAGIEAMKSTVEFENCQINFDSKMTNFNVFGSPEERDIAKAVMFIDMNLKNFNPKFLDNFARIPVKIGTVKKMNVLAEGSLEEMIIQKITFDMAQSHFELKNARTTNLLNPEKLTYEATINSTYIKRSDFANILKNIDLTAVPNFLHTHITNTKIVGNLDSVSANMNLKTGIGDVNGTAAICFSANPMRYSADLQTKSLNIANLINSPQIQTSINSTIKVAGKDFDPDKLSATVALEINHSRVNEYIIAHSKVQLDYEGGDVLKIEKILTNISHSGDFHSRDFPHSRGFTSHSGDFHSRNFSYSRRINIEKSDADFSIDELRRKNKIDISGEIGLKNLEKPNIDLTINIEDINLNSLMQNPLFPTSFSSNINLKSNSIDIDKMNANAKIDISTLSFADKSMYPFEVNAKIITDVDNLKPKIVTVAASNDFGKLMDLQVRGDISLNAITNGIAKNSELIVNLISNRINGVINNFRQEEKIVAEEIQNFVAFPKSNFDITFEAYTLHFLEFFVENFTANSANILAKIKFNSTDSKSFFSIDSMSINSLDISYDNNEIIIDDLTFSTFATVEISDSVPKISTMGINLAAPSTTNIMGMQIDSLSFSTNLKNDNFRFNFSGMYDSLITAKLNGSFEIDGNDLDLFFDSLIVIYQEEKWFNSRQVRIDCNNDGIIIRNFNLSRANKERIFLTGSLQQTKLNDINILVTNFEFNDLNKLVFSPLDIENISLFSHMDTLNLSLSGTLDNPKISSSINLKNLRYERQPIGNFTATINYEDEKIFGNARILNNSGQNLFNLDINSIPIYIGLDTAKQRFVKNKPLDVLVQMNNLPANIFTPFVPEIDRFSGRVNGRVNIGGHLPDGYRYTGNVALENVGFRLIPTNMEYTAMGEINVKTDAIEFSGLRIRNKATDLANGEALVSGKIDLERFDLKHIDISLSTRQFQILSERTETSMSWFYGRMIIATEERPLRFHGTLLEPHLDGSVTIISADMKMPQILNEEVVRREKKFTYLDKDMMRITITSTVDSAKLDSLNSAKLEEERSETSIVDLLNIDLNIRIRQFSLALDLGRMGQIFARIGTLDSRVPLRYVKHRNQAEAKIYGGNLEILDGSTVLIYRMMSARGTVSFPTARLSRPVLDLVAEARIRDQNSNINYVVEVRIKGEPDRAEISFSYSANGVLAMGGDKEREALILLMTGSLNSTNFLTESSQMVISQLASRNLSDFLIRTGLIHSANLKFEGEGVTNINAADISVSGSIYDFATWTLAGKIEETRSNYSISLDVPININREVLNDILFQMTRATNFDNSNFDRDAKNWEVKLKFGGHW